MRHENPALPHRWRLASFCLIYAAVMLYSSTIIGPAGMNFVPRDPADAFLQFLNTPYVIHGSDQRADWIGNLLMLVPFGFLVTGALWPNRRIWRLPAAVLAILACVAAVLTIKYLQLFFPPRTVTLNYIAAQSVGAAIGVVSWTVWSMAVAGPSRRRDPVAMFVLALRIYTGALLIFVMMPLDFALDATDLRLQMTRLPATLLAFPGAERPPAVRMILIVVAAAAFIPVGMLLTFVRTGVYRVRRGLSGVAFRGLLLTSLLYLLTTLVISAYPVLPSVLYRTAGILAGAVAIKWLCRQDTVRLRAWVRRSAPVLMVPYLFGVLLVNGLLSTHWLPVTEAAARAYPLGLLPLFDYYIVSKGEAAKNIIGHAVLYMPVGVLMWMRCGGSVNARAFWTAAILSFAVEAGRYLRPGLEGDINAVFLAGVAAMLAARLMPAAWSMAELLARQSASLPTRTWQARGTIKDANGSLQPAGEIEEY